MFTAMVNYAALTRLDETLALRVLERHNRMLRSVFSTFRGREVKATGAGFLVEFSSALDATLCAIEVLRTLEEYNRTATETWKVRLRIGVHLGDVVHQKGDILGDAVNVASRIEPLADVEGVCVSEPVFDQVQNKVPALMIRLPPSDLKNVRVPIDIYKVIPEWKAGSGAPAAFPAADHRRLAVLPLVNISPDPGDEYLADGLTEELIATISKLPEVTVISRTSVMAYKGRAKRIEEIGRELNVGTVLEGSVRRIGEKVRIGVQLIDATSDNHLWAENYDRELKDIFEIQREIAENVAGSLRIHLHGEERMRIAQPPTAETEAHLLYLKGRHHAEWGTKEGFLTALGLYRRALEIDPRYTLALVQLAETYTNLGFFELMSPRQAFAKAERLAREAVALDPTSPEALHSLGNALYFNGHPLRSIQLARQAVALRPNQPEAHLWMAAVFARAGRIAQTFEEAKRALDLDPLSEPTMCSVATWFQFSGHFDLALPLYERVVGLDPSNAFAWDNIGYCHVNLGEREKGLTEIRKAVGLSGTINPEIHCDLVYALARSGRVAEARTALSAIVRHHRRHRVGAFSIAKGYALLGEPDRAFEWLKIARHERSPHLSATAIEPYFHVLRLDPRFQEFVRRIGAPLGNGTDVGSSAPVNGHLSGHTGVPPAPEPAHEERRRVRGAALLCA